jgi:hypothetical protein
MDTEKKPGPNPWIAIVISVASLVISAPISIITLYFTHFYVSEDLYTVLLSFDIGKMEEKDHEGNVRSLLNGLIANIALANRGNQDIIISKIYTSYSNIAYDSVSVRRLVEAKKLNNDTLATPLLIGPRNLEQLSVRFPLDPTTLRNPPNQAEKEIHIPFVLLLSTISGSGKVQMNTIGFAELWLKDGEFVRSTGNVGDPLRIR